MDTKLKGLFFGVSQAVLIAWLLWVSRTLIDLKTEVALLRYSVFKTVSQYRGLKPESPVTDNASAGMIFPIPKFKGEK